MNGPRWFQLYVYRDRNIVRDLVRRAEREGYKALFVTVDTPILGRRLADVRNKFALPPHLRYVFHLHSTLCSKYVSETLLQEVY